MLEMDTHIMYSMQMELLHRWMKLVLDPLDVLIVAGGGAGGGRYYSGGGGAGGVVSSNSITFTGSASVTVGNGGAATGEDARGNIGSDSSFNSVTAKGGGGGGSYSTNGVGGAGGSSGGSSGYHMALVTAQLVCFNQFPSDYTAYGNAGWWWR